MNLYYSKLFNEEPTWEPINRPYLKLHNKYSYFKKYQSSKNENVFIFAHHSILKKLLNLSSLNDANDDRKLAIANCACLKLIPTENKNKYDLQVIFSGFPDKIMEYNYLKNDDIYELQISDELNNIIKNYKQIFIVRHGNGLHNKPINIKASLDSVLSNFGILQAYLLGKFLQIKKSIPTLDTFDVITSELMRAQHTGLQVLHVLDPNNIVLSDLLNHYNEKRNKISAKKTNEFKPKYITKFKRQINKELKKVCNLKLKPNEIPDYIQNIYRQVVNCDNVVFLNKSFDNPLYHNIYNGGGVKTRKNKKLYNYIRNTPRTRSKRKYSRKSRLSRI